jgi:flavin-dependent dehydrogenase
LYKLRVNTIVIVGGGTAGWMTATTFVRLFPDKKITLIESPDIKTVGVGESTIVKFRQWLSIVGIKDEDFMKHCDASYKFSIRFTNFNKIDGGRVEYPFSLPEPIDNNELNLWYFKKILHPETPNTDYADSYYPIMPLVNNNKVYKGKELGNFRFDTDTAFHFDATKFALWLRDNICLPSVKHIKSNVKDIKMNDKGIESLELDNGDNITGDLFIDCTGFKSLLLGEAMKEEFISYNDIIPNNKAWATHVEYTNKEKQLEGVTNATGLKNGWVWNIPLWSRIGTGYVYSDKHTTDVKALEEFKEHLKKNKHNITNCKFINIKMRIGIHRRLFVKNVIAIGLSAGFIEPLESNGLYTVHEFLSYLMRMFERDNISQWDRDVYNFACRHTFKSWAEFISMHYALGERDDTEYWRDNLDRVYDSTIYDLIPKKIIGFRLHMEDKIYNFRFDPKAGINCISAGYGYFPLSDNTLRYANKTEKFDYTPYMALIKQLDDRKKAWNDVVKDSPTLYEYLKKEVYE